MFEDKNDIHHFFLCKTTVGLGTTLKMLFIFSL